MARGASRPAVVTNWLCHNTRSLHCCIAELELQLQKLEAHLVNVQAPEKVAVCLFDALVLPEDPSGSTTAVDLVETTVARVTTASDHSAVLLDLSVHFSKLHDILAEVLLDINSVLSSTAVGYIGTGVAAVFFGSNYVVTKQVPIGDGFAFQWVSRAKLAIFSLKLRSS